MLFIYYSIVVPTSQRTGFRWLSILCTIFVEINMLFPYAAKYLLRSCLGWAGGSKYLLRRYDWRCRVHILQEDFTGLHATTNPKLTTTSCVFGRDSRGFESSSSPSCRRLEVRVTSQVSVGVFCAFLHERGWEMINSSGKEVLFRIHTSLRIRGIHIIEDIL